jgi:succinoglycan biosynthesis protein ExoA
LISQLETAVQIRKRSTAIPRAVMFWASSTHAASDSSPNKSMLPSTPEHSMKKPAKNTKGAISISIVVACRNEIRHIRGFLDSVLQQNMAEFGWEVIIADGLSEDGTREVLWEYSRRYAQLRSIDNPGRIVSTGLNSAIRAARGDIIIRMDAHTRYAPDYCLLCVETLEQTGADNVGGPARTHATGKYGRAVAAAYHSRFCTGARFHDVSYEGWVDTVAYGCWRKSTLERIGLFDENLVRNQDDELNLRLIRAGGKIWQNPGIMSWYSPRTTLSAISQQYFQYGFWKVAVIRKHKIPGSWRHMVPIAVILANLVLLASVAIAAMSGAPRWEIESASLWAAMLACYALANLSASAAAAERDGWDIFPYLPAAFAAYHFSWGLGFFVGLFRLPPKTATPMTNAVDSTFTRLTR